MSTPRSEPNQNGNAAGEPHQEQEQPTPQNPTTETTPATNGTSTGANPSPNGTTASYPHSLSTLSTDQIIPNTPMTEEHGATYRYGVAQTAAGASAPPLSYQERLMREMEKMEKARGTSPTRGLERGESHVMHLDAFGEPVVAAPTSPPHDSANSFGEEMRGVAEPYGNDEVSVHHAATASHDAHQPASPHSTGVPVGSFISLGGVSVNNAEVMEALPSQTFDSMTHGSGGMGLPQNSAMSNASFAATNASFMSMSLVDMPMHLQRIARQIRHLDQHDLLAIAEMTQRRTHRDVFSLLQYSGSAWYLPNIRPVKDDEKRWELSYTFQDGAVVSIAGRRMEFHPLSYSARVIILVMIWFMLWTMLPSWLMEPGSTGYVFEPMIAVALCSIVGGIICRILQLPPLIGVLWMGILWNNVPRAGYLTSGIQPEIRSIASKMGLTLILIRAGFSTNLQVVKTMWKNTVSVSFLPIACEATAHGLMANALFGYDNYTWSFLQGMVCAVVSAAVVVPGVLLLQSEGYGVGVGGPLNLALSGVGLDTVAGVWAVNFLLGLLFDNTDLGLAIALGPIQVIVGIICGVILGHIFHYAIEMFKGEAKRMPNGKFSDEHLDSVHTKTCIMFLTIGFAFVFLGYKVNLAGGGSTVTMVFALTTAHLWIKDGDNELMAQKQRLGMFLSSSWELAIMPFLFTMVGSGVDLTKVFNGDFFPKGFACWAVANAVRFTVAFACTTGTGMPTSNKILMSLSWLGKAASQGAMGGLALERITDELAGASAAERQQLEGALEFATNIKNMSVMFIMFSAPIAAISLVKMGPRVLTKTT